jgi:branched-chain amino acid transport system substrate-binding protein
VAVVGKQVVGGAKLYLDYINSQGGVNGRKIKLTSHDDSYDPDKAVKCFTCLQDEKVFAGAFFFGAPPAAKYVRLAETHKFPIVGLFTGAQMLYDPFRPYVICIRSSYYDEAMAQVNHLWDVGFRKFAVIYQNDACGAATLDGVKRALKAHGADIVGQGSFERGSTEVDDAIKGVKPKNPEVVVFDGTAPPIVKIIKQCHGSGWHPLFSSVSFLPAEAFIKLAGKDSEGTVITQVVPPYDELQLPTVALYRKLLQKLTPDQAPTFAHFEGFIDALVVCEGLKTAGRNLTRTSFIEAIGSFHNKDIGLGPDFKLNFGPKDHKGFDHVCYTVVRGGLPVVIKDWQGQVASLLKK